MPRADPQLAMGRDLKVLHLSQGNPRYEYRVREKLLESRRPTVSWAASTEGWQQGERQDCPLLLCPHEAPSEVLCPGLGYPAQEDAEMLEQVQRRAMKIIKGLEGAGLV